MFPFPKQTKVSRENRSTIFAQVGHKRIKDSSCSTLRRESDKAYSTVMRVGKGGLVFNRKTEPGDLITILDKKTGLHVRALALSGVEKVGKSGKSNSDFAYDAFTKYDNLHKLISEMSLGNKGKDDALEIDCSKYDAGVDAKK